MVFKYGYVRVREFVGAAGKEPPLFRAASAASAVADLPSR